MIMSISSIKMYVEGIKNKVVFSYVCKSGYSGTWSALDIHIGQILKIIWEGNYQ